MKKFNTTGACFSDRHYMVSLDQRIDQFKELVDAETYFVFNRARQYGKTTVLKALEKELQAQYYVASLDFQMLGNKSFEDEVLFSKSFVKLFVKKCERVSPFRQQCRSFWRSCYRMRTRMNCICLIDLFLKLSELCILSDKPIVLMIDEADNASNIKSFWIFWRSLEDII